MGKWRMRLRPQGKYLADFFRYRMVVKGLTDKFGGKFELTGEMASPASGLFEVTVNGQLIHSKKNGDGFVDSDEKMKKIIDAVQAYMETEQKNEAEKKSSSQSVGESVKKTSSTEVSKKE